MSWGLSCRSGWATEREGLRLANPGAIVLLGLLSEAGSPVTVVSLPAHDPPCMPGSLIHIRHIRGMRSSWSGEDDQLNGRMEVTVVVRSCPWLTVPCGTRMARPVRNGWGPGAT
jgi:hypothetical protein